MSFSGILLELRIAARSLLRRPAFTIPAALTLALGIGGAVAVFAITDAVLLRPLPYPDPDELVTVLHSAPGAEHGRAAEFAAERGLLRRGGELRGDRGVRDGEREPDGR